MTDVSVIYLTEMEAKVRDHAAFEAESTRHEQSICIKLARDRVS
jgi:hypothetical protein